MVKKILNKKHNELVMAVKRADLFADGIWNGLKAENTAKYLKIISTKHQFLPRKEAEDDPRWKQIIPYMVFEVNGRIFLARRKASHTDLRLASNYSIGVGGHINKKDIEGIKGIEGGSVMAWARREFEEEVDYAGDYKTELLGILNHDANEVGMVHLGLVIKVTGTSDKISIRDEHKSGELVEMAAAGRYYKQMETWSQIVYDFLRNGVGVGQNQVSGILPDWLIEKYIREGAIKISPLSGRWQECIDQVSMDFHLGESIKLFRGGTYRFVDTRRGLPPDAMEEVDLADGDPFILEPGAFAIASTREVLRLPSDILGRLEGKSSLARLGILVHSTAARFDPGWNGAPVLELGNLGPKPAILYCGMPICAFTFEKIAAPVRMPYEGSRSDRYSGSKGAIASKIEQHGERKK